MTNPLIRAKFAPLRVVALSPTLAGVLRWNYNDIARQEPKAVRECGVFFLDTRNPSAAAGRRFLKSISKTVFGYLPCCQYGASLGTRQHLSLLLDKIYELKAQGWDALELSFWEKCSPGFIRAVLSMAKAAGLKICLHIDSSLEALEGEWTSWGIDAASAAEVRSSRNTPAYRRAQGKGIPVYVTEYGTPNSPGKSQLDLKSYAIKQRMSLTLGTVELRAGRPGPAFHYHVTF